MNRQKLVTITLPVLLILIAAQPASAEDIGIIELYSSIDSADVTLHSGAHHTDITVDAELMLEEEVLRREIRDQEGSSGC